MRYDGPRRAKELGYTDEKENWAFRRGYFHGYYGRAEKPGDIVCEQYDQYPNAYSKGFWEGRAA